MGYELIDTDDLDPLPNRSSTGLELSDHYTPMDEPGNEDERTRGQETRPDSERTDGEHASDEKDECADEPLSFTLWSADAELSIHISDTEIQVRAADTESGPHSGEEADPSYGPECRVRRCQDPFSERDTASNSENGSHGSEEDLPRLPDSWEPVSPFSDRHRIQSTQRQ